MPAHAPARLSRQAETAGRGLVVQQAQVRRALAAALAQRAAPGLDARRPSALQPPRREPALR
jgi:hypothetical protein